MKKSIKIVILILTVCSSLFGQLSAFVFASSQPLKCLSVSVKTAGDEYSGDFLFQLSAVTEKAPMPQEASDEIYKFKIQSGKSASLPEVEFSRVGKYEYSVCQIPGNEAGMNYDLSEYKIFVFVTNGNDGFDYSYAVYKNGAKEKTDKIEFENSVVPPETTSPGVPATEPETTVEPTTQEPSTAEETTIEQIETTKKPSPIIEKIDHIISPFTGSNIKKTASVAAALIIAIIVAIIEIKKLKK